VRQMMVGSWSNLEICEINMILEVDETARWG
jgi:hypothetical protein